MKKIVKIFNNLISETIFKVQNKTNSNFKISNFNKYLITFIGLLFFYLFYLSIPVLYDKTWVQSYIENKLTKEFRINLSTSSDISYRILPAPHFLIKDSKILINSAKTPKSIAEIKNLKIFISQSNFLKKKKIDVKKIIINDANFILLANDFKLINEYRNNHFSRKKIIINKSNIFFKNQLDEVIAITKIKKANFFFDNEKLLNIFKLNGEVFNIPFILDLKDQINSTENKKTNIDVNLLKLNFFNESTKENDNSISGKNMILFLSSSVNTKYTINNGRIIFESFGSKIKNSKLNYSGNLSINPFDLSLNANLNSHKVSKLFNINSILTEFIRSGLFFNKNISVNTSVAVSSDTKNEIFKDAKINFNIVNGKINFNNTKFINEDIGLLQLNNSNLFIKNNNLVLKADILVNIKNSNNLFSFLNTNKKYRKEIKNILINIDYNFLNNQIKFNNIKVDNNEVSDQFLAIIDSFKNNNFNNLNKSRKLINELFQAYEG